MNVPLWWLDANPPVGGYNDPGCYITAALMLLCPPLFLAWALLRRSGVRR